MSGGRRSPGEGSVFYDSARGRWVAVLDLGQDPESGKRRRVKLSAPTKTEARERLAELRNEFRRTGTVGRQDVIVEAVVRELLASPPASWRSPATLEANIGHGDRIIAKLGRVRLARLTVGQVEGALRALAAEGYARQTIKGTRGILIQAIRRAERNGVIGRNVAVIAELPPAPRRAAKAMSLEQVGALLRLSLTPWWRAFITAAVMTGLRPGELLGLRWEDVDLKARVLRVRQTLQQRRDPERIGLVAAPLKTERSRRTLRMPAPVCSALLVLRRHQSADRLRLGEFYTDSGLVFANSAGLPRWPQAVRREFRRLCELADMGSAWTLHEMRHTFVSQLSHAGVGIEDIADLVGHATSRTTEVVYRHQLADQLGTAAEVFDGLYGKTS
jgi:integrase